MASEIGRLRQLAALKNHRVDQFGYNGLGWTEHIEGACGELAVAKTLNTYWNGSVDTFKENDLPGIQVRTRSSHTYDLIVRPEDDDLAYWVLVTGRCPKYVVRGYVTGEFAKQSRWLHEYGGRPAAYFVPQDQLQPISNLKTPNVPKTT